MGKSRKTNLGKQMPHEMMITDDDGMDFKE